jgi:pSer/pThr/pTyr-binding forkhead associated (FHA) protein
MTSCSTTTTSAATTPLSATRAPVSSSPICAPPTGVYVEGRRIRGSVALADHDRIRICHHEFDFEIEPETDSSELG